MVYVQFLLRFNNNRKWMSLPFPASAPAEIRPYFSYPARRHLAAEYEAGFMQMFHER